MVIFVLKIVNFRWIFTKTREIEIAKIGEKKFSYVSEYCASFWTKKLIWQFLKGGGICMSLTRRICMLSRIARSNVSYWDIYCLKSQIYFQSALVGLNCITLLLWQLTTVQPVVVTTVWLGQSKLCQWWWQQFIRNIFWWKYIYII